MINDKVYHLLNMDMKVLFVLLKKQGKVVSRNELLISVWSYKVKNNNLLDKSISNLRKILGFHPEFEIKTVYGDGYMFCEKES